MVLRSSSKGMDEVSMPSAIACMAALALALAQAMVRWKPPRQYSRVSSTPEPGRMSWNCENSTFSHARRKELERPGAPVRSVAAEDSTSAS